MSCADDNNPRHISTLLPSVKRLSHVTRRLLSLPVPERSEDAFILYQHSTLCQTCIPYRNPGDHVRLWNRHNGIAHLEIQAGRVLNPDTGDFTDVGLPFGPKPRLMLYHLNAEALRTRSPVIELEDSLTAFVKRTLNLNPGGRNIRIVKEQLCRLAAADFRFGATYNGHAITIKSTVIEALDIWSPRNDRQRVLWPSTVQFSHKYFESLMTHAVPLNDLAITRLAHNAMALDIYTWLAQRLHRVQPGKSTLIPWTSLQDQFGQDYTRLRDFRRIFHHTLRQVRVVYPDARFSVDRKGMHLSNSHPPVTRRVLSVK